MLRMSKFRQMEKGHAKEKMKCVGNFESAGMGLQEARAENSRKLDQPHDVTDTPPPIICSFSFPLPLFTTFFSAPRERLRRALVRFGKRRKFFESGSGRKSVRLINGTFRRTLCVLCHLPLPKEEGGGGTKERRQEKSFLETLRSTLSEINGSGRQRLAKFMEIFKVSPPLL